jgi:galactonate dehydratase
MKIARVEGLSVPVWRKNFVFVRVETDAGVVGEAYSQYNRDRPLSAQVEELGHFLIGRDPFHIRHILLIAFDDYAQRRRSQAEQTSTQVEKELDCTPWGGQA